ncbi:EamA family transporter [Streptomyces sp. NPDC048291]|uniref:EamA family transporter n=1 Tax=Streptomyces sp. NPDC048291 TaxID=3365530 RepID=UPI003715CE18
MITTLLAAVAAAGWGAADYCGARASRTMPAGRVVLLSQVLSLPVLAGWLAATADHGPDLTALAWGCGAGAFGVLGLVLLYRTLAAEGIVLVAPVTAVTAAVVPLAAGLALESAPGPFALGGVCCALLSIALVSLVGRVREATVVLRTLLLALATGAALGLQLVFISHPGPDAGLWPLAGARAVSILCVTPGALRARPETGGTSVPWLPVVLAGVLDTAAFAFCLFAADQGLLSVVGSIVSLYPAATVVLALVLDGERVTAHQALGLFLGAGALFLVTV